MFTDYNAKQLASIYKMHISTFQSYLASHRDQLKALGTNRYFRGRLMFRQNYNSEQLKYLIEEVFKDTPEGYEFNGKTLVKVEN